MVTCLVVLGQVARVRMHLVLRSGGRRDVLFELKDEHGIASKHDDVRSASAFQRQLVLEHHAPASRIRRGDTQVPEGCPEQYALLLPRRSLAGRGHGLKEAAMVEF